jgi:hypothetical protein
MEANKDLLTETEVLRAGTGKLAHEPDDLTENLTPNLKKTAEEIREDVPIPEKPKPINS